MKILTKSEEIAKDRKTLEHVETSNQIISFNELGSGSVDGPIYGHLFFFELGIEVQRICHWNVSFKAVLTVEAV